MKVGRRHQDVANVWRLEGRDVGIGPRDQKAPQDRHWREYGCLIDRDRVALGDGLFSLTCQWDDVVAQNTDSNVVKGVVGERRGSSSGVGNRVAQVAAPARIEQP